MFAHPRRGAGEAPEGESAEGDLPIDDARLEQAMEHMAGDLEGIDDDDPRQAAQLMRKFSNLTGMRFKGSIEEAIARMEAGEDPEAIEEELGDALDDEDPFELEGATGGPGRAARRWRAHVAPRRDPTLYELKSAAG